MLERSLQTVVLSLTVALSFVSIAMGATCTPLVTPKSVTLVRAKVPPGAGSYCLTKDLLQIRTPRRNEFDFRYGLVTRGAFIHINSSGTKIDLDAHAMTSDRPGKGGITNTKFSTSKVAVLKDVRVENGIIDVQVEGIGIALPWEQPAASLWSDYAHEWRKAKGYKRTPNSVPDSVREKIKRVLESGDANYHFENLTILANDFGIKVAGARNTIRGNRIEVTDSKGAIYLYGPDSVIEDNIIIFRGKAIADSSAPIKLHEASRTIIRNNIIIVQADEGAPKHVLSLIESANVEFTGNRIYGVSKITREFDEISNVKLSDNQLFELKDRPDLPVKVRKASEVR